MNFTAYVQRQKNIIRGHHCEVFITEKTEEVRLYDREELLIELDNLKGLNTPERLLHKSCSGVSA